MINIDCTRIKKRILFYFFYRGKEFRKSFSRLGQLTSIFPNIPHLALTATATSADLKVLSTTLDFRETHYIIANPDRPNIFMEIRRRLPNIKKYEKYDALLGEISQEFQETLQEFPVTIVYCDNLESVGYSYAYMHHALGEKAYCDKDQTPENRMFAQYHKDYTSKMKSHVISELSKPNPRIRLIFATVALGMGLNAPAVNRVIHFRPPTTMEKYLQEIGRAGRSGQPATAIMFFNNNDIASNRKGLDPKMREFALNTSTCLRRQMLLYFGFNESLFSGPKELCCGNCRS